jgi:hypothetical protein
MKLTPRETQKKASETPCQYNYMDKLPMKGWAWEFLRRNKQYIEAFIQLEELVKGDSWNDECQKRLSELQGIASPFGMLTGRSSHTLNETERLNYLTFQLPPYKGDKVYLNKYCGKHEIHIPKPGRRYCDFAAPAYFMRRWEMRDYIIYDSFEFLLNAKIQVGKSPNSDTLIEKPALERNKDFVYVAISKYANIVNLKDKMLKDISKILNKHKPRAIDKKWKYYLIVYDLKLESNEKMSYDQITDILNAAYPMKGDKSFTDTRKINNWHLRATSLINGEFLKHLKFQL